MSKTEPKKEKAALIDRNTFIEVARIIHDGGRVYTGITDGGFVLSENGRVIWVGYRETEDNYVVCKMVRRTEIVGQDEPRHKTEENVSVRCEFRRLRLPNVSLSEVESEFSDGERIDEGSYNGYKTKTLHEVVNETFKWY